MALDGFSATFGKGEFNVIVGYSGCGKTTLLKALAGLIAYEGVVYYDYEDVSYLPTQERNAAFVSQDFVLYPHLTVFDNVAYPLKIAKLKREEIIKRVVTVSEQLGFKACLTRKPKHISVGQQQRVALGRAIAKTPKVCLMDEPLSNVDPLLRAEIRQMLKRALKSFDSTVIYVTHDFQEAMALADRLFVMNEGKLEISGTPTEVFNSGNAVVETLKY